MRAALLLTTLVVASSCAGPSAPPAPAASTPAAAPVAVLSIRSGGAADLAIGGFTNLTFDASASTGADLRYEVEFGDGQTTTSAVSSHLATNVAAVQDGERRTARLTVTDRLGRSHSVTRQYYVVNLDSQFAWYTTQQAHALSLRVDRSNLTGWHTSQSLSRPHTGRLTGTHGIEVETEGGQFGFTGTVVWATAPSDDGSSGMWKENVRLRLKVRGGAHDGQTLDFRWNDPY